MVMWSTDVPDAAEDRCARCPKRDACRMAAAWAAEVALPEVQRRLSALSGGRNTASSPSSGRNAQTW
jgi:hypothetical protein